jgi:hypothetical protein
MTHIIYCVCWECQELCINSLCAIMTYCVVVEDKVEFCFVFYADRLIYTNIYSTLCSWYVWFTFVSGQVINCQVQPAALLSLGLQN